MGILIVDYGMSNLGSIKRALEECGANVYISNDPEDLRTAERIILPGVGSFAEGMANLLDRGWVFPIRKEVLDNGIPLLGICLGMQLLADRGDEGGDVKGLGLVPGNVERLTPNSSTERIPHVGWNEVYPTVTDELFDGIPVGTDFYFVHSYHLIPLNPSHGLATTPYCKSFVSAVKFKNIFGVQFHPEKSGQPGFCLLSNFLKFRS